MTTDYTRPAGPLQDLYNGIAWHELWRFLAWRRLRDSYRRTKLGPLWITIGVCVFVGGFSVIGSQLFRVDPRKFLPELAVGFVIWQLVSAVILNGCTTLRTYASVRQSRAIPFTTFIGSNLAAEVLKFFHHIVIWPLIALLFVPFTPNVPLAIAFFALLIANLFFASYVLAIICVRVADLQHVVTAAVQLLFFLTPVIWPVDRLKGLGVDWVFLFNPLYYLIHPLKAAVLGVPLESNEVLGFVGLTLLSAVIFAVTFRFTYHRIQFWL